MTFLNKLKSVLLGGSDGPESLPSAVKPGLRYTNTRSPDGPHFVTFDRLVKRKDGALVFVLELSGSRPDARERLTRALEAIEQNSEVIAEIHMTQADFSVLDSWFAGLSATYPSAFQRIDAILIDAPPEP